MPYKSIREAIKAMDGENLFCLAPGLEGEEMPRTVFVSREVLDAVTPPFDEHRVGLRHGSLRALLDSFTEGGWITVAENPRKKAPGAILARVEPLCAEIWDFRCLDPKPGIRTFGRFAEIDTFVALTWDYRENIENNDYWTHQVEECQAAWHNLFGTLPLYKGNTLSEYLSYNYESV